MIKIYFNNPHFYAIFTIRYEKMIKIISLKYY